MLFVVDDGKWKVVNLTNINDFMIAMTSFLKSDKSTRGVALVSAEQVAGRRGAGRSRHNYNLVKTKTHFVSNFDQSSGYCCDPLIDPRYFVSKSPEYFTSN